jgi:methylase of polypeptide subunit release factors
MRDRIATVDATAYLSPYPRRRVRRPIRLRLTEHTYPLEPAVDQSWLPIAFRAFEQLARRRAIEDVLIVGTGNGLDALGAAEILNPRSITITDLYEESLAVSRENIVSHLRACGSIELSFHAGDLLSGVPGQRRFSLIYENLPNVPSSPDLDLRHGTLGGRFYSPHELAVPEPFASYMLALHHRLLTDAWPRITDRGGVLTAIGGRVPDEVAFGLHRACGYTPELAAYDVKLQVEPQLMIPPYSRAETGTGVEFRFYAPDAIDVVRRLRADGLEGQALADAAAPALDSLSMPAREAAARVERALPVAHSVLMIFGERR